ncbi:MAG: hypothetical protein OEW15_01700 [Nitrospirota bacterium]|nr:hypothetical protein [Nitrospirota bacterium]
MKQIRNQVVLGVTLIIISSARYVARIRIFHSARRTFLLGLLENQNLLEHETFTELLWGLDYITGPEISFVVFFLFPIFLVTWYAGEGAGIVISLLSGIAWFTSDVLTSASDAYPHPGVIAPAIAGP